MTNFAFHLPFFGLSLTRPDCGTTPRSAIPSSVNRDTLAPPASSLPGFTPPGVLVAVVRHLRVWWRDGATGRPGELAGGRDLLRAGAPQRPTAMVMTAAFGGRTYHR